MCIVGGFICKQKIRQLLSKQILLYYMCQKNKNRIDITKYLQQQPRNKGMPNPNVILHNLK